MSIAGVAICVFKPITCGGVTAYNVIYLKCDYCWWGKKMVCNKIGFVGGDRRMIECAKEMANEGYETAVCGFDDYDGDFGDTIRTDLRGAILRSDAIVLPLPCTSYGSTINTRYSGQKIEADEVFSLVGAGSRVFCGRATQDIIELAAKRGLQIIDYYASERLQILNSIPTVEGALCEAMRRSDITLHSSRCLVTGYGRIARLLSRALYFLGANVTVCARSYDELTWARALGLNTRHLSELKQGFAEYDFIFNTVPSRIIDGETLSLAKSTAIIIELASTPGGFDSEKAKKHFQSVIYAQGLPGRNAPKSAGVYISKVLLEYLKS